MVRQEVEGYFSLMELELESMEELPALQKLDRLFRTIVTHFRDIEKLRFWRWMMFFGTDASQAPGIRGLVAQREQRFAAFVRSIVEDGMEEGTLRRTDPRKVMYLYVTILQGILDGLLMFRDSQQIDEYVDVVLESFWESIKA